MNFLQALKIHKKLGLILMLSVPLITWLHLLTETPIYESTARLLIEAKDLGFSNYANAQPFTVLGVYSDPIETQMEILRSSTILDKVVRQFNLRYKWGPKKGQFQSPVSIRENFEVEPLRKMDIVELKYKDPNPLTAKNILRAITDSYIEKTIELKASDTTSAIRFLKGEKRKAEREVLDTSKRLKEFEERTRIIDLDTSKEVVKTSFSLKSLRLSAETQYVKAKSASDQLVTQLMAGIDEALLLSTVSSDPFLGALRKDLYEKETQLVKIQAKVKPGHYQLEEINEQIKGDKKLIEERMKELVGDQIDIMSFVYSQDPIRSELTGKLLQAKSGELAIKEELDVLDNAIKDIDKKVEELPKEKYIYSQLLRQHDTAKKRLEGIEEKLIEAKLKGVIDSHITNIRIIDPPSLTESPISPDIPKALFASFILGLFLAGAIIYLVEYFDDVIKSIDTLPKEMGCPLLAQLPYSQMGDLPIVYQEPKSGYTEAIHGLRTNVSYLAVSTGNKLLLITSPTKNEGKSTVSVNLAATYAQTGKRVLLIDGDIRNPTVHKYLAIPKGSSGICNVLINESDFYDVVKKGVLGIAGFDYLPGGEVPPNPVQLLESNKMKELIETARHIYDLIILDTPPIGIFSDALLLARYADIVTIVARFNKTSRKGLLASIELLKKVNIQSIGIILNAIPLNTYGYGGYGYYSYGYEYAKEKPGESAA